MQPKVLTDDILINTAEAASLLGIDKRSVNRNAAQGKIKAHDGKSAAGGGRDGEARAICLSSLPPAAQAKYHTELAISRLQTVSHDFDLVSYSQQKGLLGTKKLQLRQEAVTRVTAIRAQAARNVTEQIRTLADEYGVSERTLFRWEAEYQQNGLKGIARKERSDKGESHSMCAEARRYICAEYLDPKKRTQQYILEKLWERAAELGPSGCRECPYNPQSRNHIALRNGPDAQFFPACDRAGNGIITPGTRYAVNNVVASITEAEKVYMRTGRKAWEAAHMVKCSRAKPSEVNLCWFGDHTEFDVFVVDELGRLTRPWLTAWYDIATGMLVGWCLSTNPNSETILEAFARAVAVKRDSPIWGAPCHLYIDNGKDYRGHRMEGGRLSEVELGTINSALTDCGLLKLLHIEVHHAQPYHGWVKPVERWFRTLEERYCRELPGYCGGNPHARTENFDRQLRALHERGELLTLDEFADTFVHSILPAYASHPHEGYGGKTPVQLYAELPKARTEIIGWHTLAAIKMESDKRRVAPTGIKFDKKLFWHEELRHLTNEWVMIRYNRGDSRSITVCTLDGRFVCEAEPKAYFKYVGEAESNVSAHIALQRRQEGELRQTIRARGVKLPGKRASGNLYYEMVDATASANIYDFQAERAMRARNEVREEQKARIERTDEAANDVRDMFISLGDRLLSGGAK